MARIAAEAEVGMTRNREPSETLRHLTDEEADAGFASIDHADAVNALHTLRRCAERELMRLSWLMSMPLIPPTTYQSITRRVMAEALDSVWGDYDAARRVLSPELYKELLWLLSGLPMSDLDWAMRIFALSDAAPQPAVPT